jgi:hypothetical protein
MVKLEYDPLPNPKPATKKALLEYDGELTKSQRKQIKEVFDGKGTSRHKLRAISRLLEKFKAENKRAEARTKELNELTHNKETFKPLQK